jgi:type I restriction enzyme M protein
MIYKQRTAAHRTRTPRTEGGGVVVVALKKSDLYSSLWKGAYELRGGMDTSQYKDYVLTLLFVKHVKDKSKSKSDKNSLTDLPSGGSFDNLVTFKGDKEIGDKTNKAIRKLTEGADERAWRGEIKRLRATVDPGQITEEVIDCLV